MGLGQSIGHSLAGGIVAQRLGVSNPREALQVGYTCDYDARPAWWTPGTPPDIAAAVDRSWLPPVKDVSQATATRRPHDGVMLNNPVFDYGPVPSATLGSAAGANVWNAGDSVGFIVVIKSTLVAAPLKSVISMQPAWLFHSATGNITFRCPAGGGTQDVNTPMAGTAKTHVVACQHTGDRSLRQTLALDGTEVANVAIAAQSSASAGVLLGQWAGFIAPDAGLARVLICARAHPWQMRVAALYCIVRYRA